MVRDDWGYMQILNPVISALNHQDGHEICFVGEEAFHDLSQVDATANKLLEDAIAEDKSVEWFAKYHVPKPSA
ncbi:hypothetical protein chiPu_0009682 [Chiloscyllium punctatum]|uniref:Uncharacterized protein n=1 Tax=Chiloscyllium punctatum TaxID=137246 RepID=A0A401SLE4_CHIPU|nr:hypothetical protein [Chiloscyllium punctatum]